MDYNNNDVCGNFHKQHEFKKQTVLADESLTKDEKIEAIKILNQNYDRDKILNNEETKRFCFKSSKKMNDLRNCGDR